MIRSDLTWVVLVWTTIHIITPTHHYAGDLFHIIGLLLAAFMHTRPRVARAVCFFMFISTAPYTTRPFVLKDSFYFWFIVIVAVCTIHQDTNDTRAVIDLQPPRIHARTRCSIIPVRVVS